MPRASLLGALLELRLERHQLREGRIRIRLLLAPVLPAPARAALAASGRARCSGRGTLSAAGAAGRARLPPARRSSRLILPARLLAIRAVLRRSLDPAGAAAPPGRGRSCGRSAAPCAGAAGHRRPSWRCSLRRSAPVAGMAVMMATPEPPDFDRDRLSRLRRARAGSAVSVGRWGSAAPDSAGSAASSSGRRCRTRPRRRRLQRPRLPRLGRRGGVESRIRVGSARLFRRSDRIGGRRDPGCASAEYSVQLRQAKRSRRPAASAAVFGRARLARTSPFVAGFLGRGPLRPE